MNKKTIFGLLLVAVITLGGVPQALAFSSYMDSFNTKYGTSGTNGGTTLGSCITCHTNPTGGAGWNDYGLDVQARLAAGDSIDQALTNIEANDSDKDTFSNIVEINARTFPGDPNSHPASDTPPVITITSPTDGQTFTTNAITISGTASDDVGVSKVEVKVGAAGSYAAATGNTSWSAPVTLASGSNTIYARATDTAGQTTETSVTVTYNPSTSPTDAPPVIAITYPIDGQNFTTDTITVNGTASDDVGVSKVEVKVGAAGSWQIATGTDSWNSSVTLVSGSNTIYARATDTSGNSTETSVTVNYNPQIPPPGTPPSTAVKVTFKVFDNETGLPIAGAKVSMNGSKIKTDDNGTAIFTNIIPGDYKYKVRAEDYEKNKDNISVTGDTTVTVKLVPETEEDEDNEDGTHGNVHWLENMSDNNPCTGSTAGSRNNETA